MQILHSLIASSSSLFSPSTCSIPSLLPPHIIQSTSTSKTTRPATSLHFLHFNPAARSPVLTPPIHASNPNPNNNDAIDSTTVTTAKDLHLLEKPSPSPTTSATAIDDNQESLAPFLKFFTSRQDTTTSTSSSSSSTTVANRIKKGKRDGSKCYDPKPGDLAVGVVVSGDENKLDVEIAADELGIMLTKDVLPLHTEEALSLVCDIRKDVEKFAVAGRFGIVKDEEAFRGEETKVAGRPVVDVGGIVFVEVLGLTLSGRPLLSARRVFRRVAWHRVRQIKQLKEPVQVKVFEWNAGGLLSRIEGLRAFLPKAELINRVSNFTDLKNNVGRQINVCVTRVDEANSELIISEKEAWEMMYLKEGTLLEGVVSKILPYGARVRIIGTNRSGLLHISNISHAHVTSITDVLKVNDKLKVLVVKSMVPDKIALSIEELESEPGLFLSNREKVFLEAEEMAKKYRQRLPVISANKKLDTLDSDVLPFDSEAVSYSNWKWFKFENLDNVKSNYDTET